MSSLQKVVEPEALTSLEQETLRELADEYRIDYIDLEGFAITEEGRLILCDECLRFGYVDMERFEVEVDPEEFKERMLNRSK